MEHQKSFYEQQIAGMREQLQQALKEKNEFEATQMKFQSMSAEYEDRYWAVLSVHLLFYVFYSCNQKLMMMLMLDYDTK